MWLIFIDLWLFCSICFVGRRTGKRAVTGPCIWKVSSFFGKVHDPRWPHRLDGEPKQLSRESHSFNDLFSQKFTESKHARQEVWVETVVFHEQLPSLSCEAKHSHSPRPHYNSHDLLIDAFVIGQCFIDCRKHWLIRTVALIIQDVTPPEMLTKMSDKLPTKIHYFRELWDAYFGSLI